MKKENKTKNEINEEKLKDATGGSLFDRYNDAEYNSAGVDVVGSGFFYNDGYRYKGKDITNDEANILVKYRQHFGSVAPTLEDAKSWWKYHCS